MESLIDDVPFFDWGDGWVGSKRNTMVHSQSTGEEPLGEYRYTVTRGQHALRITGNNLHLIRVSTSHFTPFCFADVCLSVYLYSEPNIPIYPLLTDGQTGTWRVLQWWTQSEQYCSSTRHRQQQVCRELSTVLDFMYRQSEFFIFATKMHWFLVIWYYDFKYTFWCLSYVLSCEHIWYNFPGLYFI